MRMLLKKLFLRSITADFFGGGEKGGIVGVDNQERRGSFRCDTKQSRRYCERGVKTKAGGV